MLCTHHVPSILPSRRGAAAGAAAGAQLAGQCSAATAATAATSTGGRQHSHGHGIPLLDLKALAAGLALALLLLLCLLLLLHLQESASRASADSGGERQPAVAGRVESGMCAPVTLAHASWAGTSRLAALRAGKPGGSRASERSEPPRLGGGRSGPAAAEQGCWPAAPPWGQCPPLRCLPWLRHALIRIRGPSLRVAHAVQAFDRRMWSCRLV